MINERWFCLGVVHILHKHIGEAGRGFGQLLTEGGGGVSLSACVSKAFLDKSRNFNIHTLILGSFHSYTTKFRIILDQNFTNENIFP